MPNPYSRPVATHMPTPEELALMSTKFINAEDPSFFERVEKTAEEIKQRKAMKETLEKNPSKKH